MAWKWKTVPVYPGVKLDSGDTSYTPGNNSDYDRINK